MERGICGSGMVQIICFQDFPEIWGVDPVLPTGTFAKAA
jgi:hypothetical protein